MVLRSLDLLAFGAHFCLHQEERSEVCREMNQKAERGGKNSGVIIESEEFLCPLPFRECCKEAARCPAYQHKEELSLVGGIWEWRHFEYLASAWSWKLLNGSDGVEFACKMSVSFSVITFWIFPQIR